MVGGMGVAVGVSVNGGIVRTVWVAWRCTNAWAVAVWSTVGVGSLGRVPVAGTTLSAGVTVAASGVAVIAGGVGVSIDTTATAVGLLMILGKMPLAKRIVMARPITTTAAMRIPAFGPFLSALPNPFSNASANSRALSQRSHGLSASAFMTTLSNREGIPRRNWLGGVPGRWCLYGLPVSISNNTQPRAKMSAAGRSTPPPRSCSGAMYNGVPGCAPPIPMERPLSPGNCAKPKSDNRASPASVSKILEGVTSRCTGPVLSAWNPASASHT